MWKDGVLFAGRRHGQFVLELYETEDLKEKIFVEQVEIREAQADPANFSDGQIIALPRHPVRLEDRPTIKKGTMPERSPGIGPAPYPKPRSGLPQLDLPNLNAQTDRLRESASTGPTRSHPSALKKQTTKMQEELQEQLLMKETSGYFQEWNEDDEVGSVVRYRDWLRSLGLFIFTEEQIKRYSRDAVLWQMSQLEKKRAKTRDEVLALFLQRLALTSETLSDLARQRESFGLAWLGVFLCQKTKRLDKVSVSPPSSFDLSGTRRICPEKVSLMLDQIPPSALDVTLDGAAVRGARFPLFLRFFGRLEAGVRGGEASRLKSFLFPENSILPLEASRALPLLPPSLQSLCLKGNFLGPEGTRGLVEGLRTLRLCSLLTLDLENTGVDEGELRGGCRFWERGVRCLAESLSEGGLMSLETLDLQGSVCGEGGGFFGGAFLGPLGKGLCWGSVPCLKTLNLFDMRLFGGGLASVLRALRAADRPPLLHGCVEVGSQSLCKKMLRSLGEGGYPSLRSLRLFLENGDVETFFERLVEVPDRPHFESLEFKRERHEEEEEEEEEEETSLLADGLRLVGQAIWMGRLSSLEKLSITTNDPKAVPSEISVDDATGLFSMLALQNLPKLSELSIVDLCLTDVDVDLLAQAVRAGNLSALRCSVYRRRWTSFGGYGLLDLWGWVH
uniref:Uncharacterized protein n=1 Tax=Chromera velia CCMP2878 TaxID=1169474 RepID=A0A0G4H1U4_9ALVE|eukprot:Cvel_24308.t1-p1 / transcript=Cvel_24308.t1 / gene=Cvel_24308 / organism=Chromera_velia_CCMP2878 / gene_product=Uncharacterized protein LOC284861, putative / transcript_product=Uncharacterized protein LOC284861, putative / location=Cvel_scaffold2611:9316-15047(-) / protein_length=674 / sequence_SO=supercontig / SO=protein_coding / is_pseudo=false